jgi:uncharacterized phage protein gp47/JayE
MSGTVPTTPVCYIDQLGIHAPTYTDVLNYLIAQYQNIYGADVYLGADSQDGQLLALFALAISDANAMAVSVYQSFSPQTAIGNGLSSVVKINNMRRLAASNSTADLVVTGVAGTTIVNGIARDGNNNNWMLPSPVVIPPSGTITVTAVAQAQGAIAAAPATITQIATPIVGWQTVSNPNAAVAGDPIETDAALRVRQAVSTALPSQTVLDGIAGAVAQVPGVLRYAVYENDTSVTDANGVPDHSISFVVDGGDAAAIAQAIALKKTPGAGTYGTTTIGVEDNQGVVHNISFFRPALVPITVAMTIAPQTGYTTATGALIAQAVVDAINALPIGAPVFLSKLYAAAYSTAAANTYNVTVLNIAASGPPQAADVAIAFNQAASCALTNVTMTVLVNPAGP